MTSLRNRVTTVATLLAASTALAVGPAIAVDGLEDAPVVSPVAEAAAPVTAPAAPVVAPAVEAAAPVVEAAGPVVEAAAPVTGPVEEQVVAPVAEQVVAPIAGAVAEGAAPVTDPVGDAVGGGDDAVDAPEATTSTPRRRDPRPSPSPSATPGPGDEADLVAPAPSAPRVTETTLRRDGRMPALRSRFGAVSAPVVETAAPEVATPQVALDRLVAGDGAILAAPDLGIPEGTEEKVLLARVLASALLAGTAATWIVVRRRELAASLA